MLQFSGPGGFPKLLALATRDTRTSFATFGLSFNAATCDEQVTA